jgi:hypothetical protein
MYLREMPNGDLLADPGGPAPGVPPGYTRDAAQPHRLHLAPEPRDCAKRDIRQCPQQRSPRWHCAQKGIVNPGVCCRCQGIIEPLANPMEV